MGVGTTYLRAGPSSGFLLQIRKTSKAWHVVRWERLIGASLRDGEQFPSRERGTGQENSPGLGKPYLRMDGVGHPCGQPIF